MPRTEQQGRCSSVVASGPHPRRPLLGRPAPRGRLLRPPFGLAEDGVHAAWPRRARLSCCHSRGGRCVAADCGRRPLGRCRRSSSVACSWTWPLCPTLAASAPTRWPGPMTPRSRRRRDPDATQAGLVARARPGTCTRSGSWPALAPIAWSPRCCGCAATATRPRMWPRRSCYGPGGGGISRFRAAPGSLPGSTGSRSTKPAAHCG